MKLWTLLTTLGATTAALALSLSAFGAGSPIASGPHNMNNDFEGNIIPQAQICLPCHAPHNQPVDATTSAKLGKLWNHVMPLASSYTLYSGATQLDETSRKCLSCHDGTVAVDAYGGAGGPASTIGAANPAHKIGAAGSGTSGFLVGAGGDLSHDHPVGYAYPGWDGTTWTGAGNGFKSPTTFLTTSYASSTQNPDGSYQTATYTTDGTTPLTPLSSYSKISLAKAPGASKGTLVGCGSCHTPHDHTYNYLKLPNYGSQLCLTCHDK